MITFSFVQDNDSSVIKYCKFRMSVYLTLCKHTDGVHYTGKHGRHMGNHFDLMFNIILCVASMPIHQRVLSSSVGQ